MENQLKGKNIIITGGTHGIGRGMVLGAAQAGANILTCGRNQEAGIELCKLAAQYPGTIEFLKSDISLVKDCKNLVDEAVKKFGVIDGLVNNAAIFPRCDYSKVSEEYFDKIFNVNIKGTFFVTKYVIETMKKSKKGGSIVNIGSINAFAGEPALAVYSCSKGAVHTLSRHVAANYGEDGIRSNWVTVGWVATETEMSRFGSKEDAMKELDSLAKKYIPLGRLQTPNDISNSVNFLLSDESNQITGTEIHVTGGKYF